MKEKCKQITQTILVACLVFGLALFSWLRPADAYSDSERRSLAAAPEFSWEGVLDGGFMSDFETYTQDQFPFRERFRALKSASALYLFGQKTVNDLYLAEGHISKVEPQIKEQMLNHATERFTYLKDTYFPEKTPLLAVVPNKNFYLAEKHGYPTFDHETLVEKLSDALPNFSVMDLSEYLELSDYYNTDTHWKQENIADVADFLAGKFGKTLPQEYNSVPMHVPFYGVYHGQLALPVKPDVIFHMKNPIIDGLSATSYDSGKPESVPVYNFEKGEGKDGYELFLGGSHAVITLENSAAEGELVVFCDSFGTSMAPLLAQGYAKTTLVDIRYIPSGMVGNFVEFENADILFLYSTMMLNNSGTMK